MEINKPKYVWMDLAKIIASFLIVLQHSTSKSWTSMPVTTLEWKIINILFLLSKIAIPVFIMCSGAGMLSKERSIASLWKKNILNLVKVYCAWMLVYGIRNAVTVYVYETHDIGKLFNAILKSLLFGEYHTWFIIMLIGLYMVIPLLYKIIENESLTKYFLVLSVLFTVLIPIMEPFQAFERINTVVSNMNMHFVVGYSMYFVLGHYLTTIDYNKMKIKYIISFFSILAFSLLISTVVSIKLQSANQDAFSEFSIFMLIMVTLLFIILIKLEPVFQKKKTGIFIARYAKYGIVIYLVHPLFLFLIPDSAGIFSVCYAVAIWFISLLIGIAISKISVIKKIFM